jgi:hypothetical protein
VTTLHFLLQKLKLKKMKTSENWQFELREITKHFMEKSYREKLAVQDGGGDK